MFGITDNTIKPASGCLATLLAELLSTTSALHWNWNLPYTEKIKFNYPLFPGRMCYKCHFLQSCLMFMIYISDHDQMYKKSAHQH